MAQVKKSVKIGSKTSKNTKLNPSSEKIKKKVKVQPNKQANSHLKVQPSKQPKSDMKVQPSKQPKSDMKVQPSKQPRSDIDVNAKKVKNSDEYSINDTKPEERNSSMKVYFPCQFSMLQNMDFLDHISDAENIIFDNSIYAICKDVTTAEALCASANGLRFQGGKNSILRADRLGPAFCAFKRKVVDPTVLTIKKLPPGLSYQDVQCRFPGVLDICLKKKMAKLKFADAASCKLAWLRSRDIVWPQGAAPCVDNLLHDCDAVHSDEEVDPEQLKFGHPSKFVEDPCVLFLLLKKRFELTKGMEVLDVLKTATDIILSKSCTVVFSTFKEALKRRQLLAGHSLSGGDVVTWMSARPHVDVKDNKSHKLAKKTVTNTEADSDGEDEEELSMAPPAKKVKKEDAK